MHIWTQLVYITIFVFKLYLSINIYICIYIYSYICKCVLGRKIEANIGNVRLANTVAFNLGSDSFVPLRIEGMKRFV
jgi:hypothetical protein